MKCDMSWDDKVENSLYYIAKGIDEINNRVEKLFDFLLIELGDEEEKREYKDDAVGHE